MTALRAMNGRMLLWAGLVALGAAILAGGALAQGDATRDGVILTMNGPVTPPMADYLEREIRQADDADAELVVIEIDTPGGLVDSMKTIIKAILASETPVATYVSPQGARSASAGLYIMYASHVAAMAPYTNTGAATPVEVGGGGGDGENPFEGEDLFPTRPADPEPSASEDEAVSETGSEEAGSDDASADEDDAESAQRPPALGNEDAMRAKIINDSVAYIRALAEGRERNADWAERAVREGVSITANQALELGVVEIIAKDLEDLLDQLDGRTVTTIDGEKTLSTKDLKLTRAEPQFVEQVLNFIANPNVAVILMSLGTTGIIIEMWNPGSIFPGALGALCLILGFYSFQVLPFNWLGVALMGVGVILMTLEAFTPTFGIAGLTGLLAFAAGLFVIFPAGFEVAPAVIGTIVAVCGAFLGMVLVAVVGSRNHGPLIGADAIKKREGYVDEWDGAEGWVIVEGERWRARSDKPLKPGDKIRVIDVDGLVLVVRQAKAGGILASLAPNEA
ncbi:MAG: nodulation protein NfeD [Pseudomonadota bacterium]